MGVLPHPDILNAVIDTDHELVPLTRLDITRHVTQMRRRKGCLMQDLLSVHEDGGLYMRPFQKQGDMLLLPGCRYIDMTTIPGLPHIVVLWCQEEGELQMLLLTVLLHIGIEIIGRVVERTRPTGVHRHGITLAIGKHRARQHHVVVVMCAVAYRQLTGCKPKLVAKELAGIKDQGLMIQKGRTRGTYYVPAGSLKESIEDEKHKLTSQVIAETTTSQAVMSTARGVMMTPRQVDIPDVLQKKIAALKRRVPGKVMQSVIVELCAVRAMGRIELSKILKRSPVTIDRLVAPLIGKELDYLYPMMPHHPRQAYVALDRHQKEDVS